MAVMKELLIGQDEQPSNNPQDCTAVEAPKATVLTDVARVIRSVHPDAKVDVTISVLDSWLDYLAKHARTLPQAQEIAAALIAEYGGSVEVIPLPNSGVCDGAVTVTLASGDLGTTKVDIFYGEGATANV